MKGKKVFSLVLCVFMAISFVMLAGCGEVKKADTAKDSSVSNPTADIKNQQQKAGSDAAAATTEQKKEPLKAVKADGKPVVIGVTLMSLRHPFFQDMKAEMDKITQETGVVLKIVSGDFDAGLQAKQVEDFIQQKVDVICVSPTDSKAIGPAAKKAIAAGIPVITIDSIAEGADTLSHVASDNVEGGRIAARLMVGALKARSIDKGVIGVVDHPTVTSVQDRTKGFKEIMDKELPNIKLEQLVALGQRDKAMSVTEDAMQKFGDNMVAVFGINDDSALGALSAIERANKLSKITIVGYDLGTESKAAIEAGKIVGDAVQFPGFMGRVAVETGIKWAAGIEKNPPKLQPIDVGSYTKEGFKDQKGNKISGN